MTNGKILKEDKRQGMSASSEFSDKKIQYIAVYELLLLYIVYDIFYRF
jgi:hypothetical protein